MTTRKIMWVLLCFLLSGTVLLTGCKKEVSAVPTLQPKTSSQRLHISGTVNEDSGRSEYTVPGTKRSVSVYYFDDITIEIDGSQVLLQEAVEQGKIMPEEIAAYARLDAVDGYCKVNVNSEKGLTTFTYVYVDRFIVKVVDDILETPDGKQHHIETVDIYAPNRATNTSRTYYGDDGQPLAQEDWGISFAVEDASSTGLTLVCTQTGGGQQAGTLTLESFMLCRMDTNELIHKKDNTVGHAIEGENGMVAIEQNTTGRVSVDWSETFGEIPSGEYMMILTVLDVFDKNEIHPLIVKYQYSQNHQIKFTVP